MACVRVTLVSVGVALALSACGSSAEKPAGPTVAEWTKQANAECSGYKEARSAMTSTDGDVDLAQLITDLKKANDAALAKITALRAPNSISVDLSDWKTKSRAFSAALQKLVDDFDEGGTTAAAGDVESVSTSRDEAEAAAVKLGVADCGGPTDAELQAQAEAKARAARAERVATQRKIKAARTVSARSLALVIKDPDSHVGEVFIVWGSIKQFDAATGTSNFRADVADHNITSYGYFNGENSWFEGSENSLKSFVADDLFTAVVEVAGSYSYDTQNGGNTTVPKFKILKISHR